MLKIIIGLILAVCVMCFGVEAGQADEPTGDQIKAQAETAVGQHKWEEAYSLYLSAQSTYISEGNQKAADEMGATAERVRKEWIASTASSPAPGGNAKHPLWTAFTPKSGTPKGRYLCSSMVERFIGMSSVGPGSMPLRVPEIVFLSPIVFSPGKYVLVQDKTSGTWSGSGSSIHLSGKLFKNARGEYGANGSGRSTVRFAFPVANARPVIWMCSQ